MSAAVIVRGSNVAVSWQDSVQMILEQLRCVSVVQQTILQRVTALEVDSAVQRQSRPVREHGWECPVCLQSFKHRSSFKGHIFRLAHPSSRPKCFLNEENPAHVALLDDPRFAGATFPDRALRFVASFWSTVHDLSSSRTSSSTSLGMIKRWIDDTHDGLDGDMSGDLPVFADMEIRHSDYSDALAPQ